MLWARLKSRHWDAVLVVQNEAEHASCALKLRDDELLHAGLHTCGEYVKAVL